MSLTCFFSLFFFPTNTTFNPSTTEQQQILFKHLDDLKEKDDLAKKNNKKSGDDNSNGKFISSKMLVTGLLEDATGGLKCFLGVKNETWNNIVSGKGEQEMIKEIKQIRKSKKQILPWKGATKNAEVGK